MFVHKERLDIFFKAADKSRALFCNDEKSETSELENIIQNCEGVETRDVETQLRRYVDVMKKKYSNGNGAARKKKRSFLSSEKAVTATPGDPISERICTEYYQAFDR